MRHSWKKIENKDLYITYPKYNKETMHHSVFKPMECVHCGLRKGCVRSTAYQSEIVYFEKSSMNGSKALSFGKLPYKCYDAPNSIFISKEDFYVQ